jgi:hypothetical protein
MYHHGFQTLARRFNVLALLLQKRAKDQTLALDMSI